MGGGRVRGKAEGARRGGMLGAVGSLPARRRRPRTHPHVVALEPADKVGALTSNVRDGQHAKQTAAGEGGKAQVVRQAAAARGCRVGVPLLCACARARPLTR